MTILLSFIYNSRSYGQNLIGESRRTTVPNSFQEYSQISRTAKTSLPNTGYKNIPINARFTIVNLDGDNYVVYFWDWDTTKPNYANLNFDATLNEIRYFLIPVSIITNVSEKIYRRFSPSVGSLSFPFRYRPQDSKIEKNFSISMCGGMKWNPWRINEHTFSALLGVGASSVTLDKYNTGPNSNITEASERAAITMSLSVMYEWQNLQIGLSSGLDNLFDNRVEEWKYQGKPWLTLGVGISIFSKSEIGNPGSN
jgi:hypothetical protein